MMALNRVFRTGSTLTVEDDGLNVTGYAVPFDVDAEVDDHDGNGPYVERFRYGSFRHVVRAPHVVDFRYRHDDDLLAWVGKTVMLREDRRGLWGHWRLDNNDRGRALAYKIADGQLPALSVSYVPGETHTARNRAGRLVRERHNVRRLDHVAVVPVGAYPTAEPLTVRAAAPAEVSTVDRWREWRNGLSVPE